MTSQGSRASLAALSSSAILASACSLAKRASFKAACGVRSTGKGGCEFWGGRVVDGPMIHGKFSWKIHDNLLFIAGLPMKTGDFLELSGWFGIVWQRVLMVENDDVLVKSYSND